MFSVDMNKKIWITHGVVMERIGPKFKIETTLGFIGYAFVLPKLRKKPVPGDKVCIEFSAFDDELTHGKIIEIIK